MIASTASSYRDWTAARDRVSSALAVARSVFAFVSRASEAARRALATVCTAATAANPPSIVNSTRLAAITAPRCFRTNFRSR